MDSNFTIQPSNLTSIQSSLDVKSGMISRLKEEKAQTQEDGLLTLTQLFQELQALDPTKKVETTLFVTVLGRAGIRTYPQFDKALCYLLSSLQLQLQDIGAIDEEDFSSYKSLQDIEEGKPAFPKALHFITTTPSENYPAILNSLNDEQKMDLADTLLYTAWTLHNLGKGKLGLDERSFFGVMQEMYAAVKQILQSIQNQTDAVKERVGEIQYNNISSMTLDKIKLERPLTKEDIRNYYPSLEESLEYNDSKAMQARIANLKACTIGSFGDQDAQEEAKALLETSLTLWDEVLQNSELTPAERERYERLYGNVSGTYIATMTKLGHTDTQSMPVLIKYEESLRKAFETTQSKDPYAMIRGLNLAKIEDRKGNSKEAVKYLTQVMEIAKSYQTWPQTVSIMAQVGQFGLEMQQKLLMNQQRS